MKASTPFLTQDRLRTSGSAGSARGVQGQASDASSALSAGCRRQLVDPLGDGCDVGFRQRTAGQGHAGLLFPHEVLDEGAGAALPSQHRGTRQGAALEDIGHALQRQSALAGFAVVAGKAVAVQDGPDFAFELLLQLRRDGSYLSGGGKGQDRQKTENQ